MIFRAAKVLSENEREQRNGHEASGFTAPISGPSGSDGSNNVNIINMMEARVVCRTKIPLGTPRAPLIT